MRDTVVPQKLIPVRVENFVVADSQPAIGASLSVHSLVGER
jgi:hypothetical protein